MTHVADDPAVCIPGSVGGRVHRRRSATVSNASESVGGARDAPWARAAVLARARHGPLRNGPNWGQLSLGDPVWHRRRPLTCTNAERVTRIELALSAWEAEVLSLI